MTSHNPQDELEKVVLEIMGFVNIGDDKGLYYNSLEINKILESYASHKVVEATSEILIEASFLQAELTVLLLERNTYNRDEKIQEQLEEIVERAGNIVKILNPTKR